MMFREKQKLRENEGKTFGSIGKIAYLCIMQNAA